MSARVIRFPVERARRPTPPAASPLQGFNLSSSPGKRRKRRHEGQQLLDFDGAAKRAREAAELAKRAPGGEVVQLRPANAARLAYDLYVQGGKLDEDPATYDEAEALYERALQFDPKLSICMVNLGNILYRRGQERRAESLYRQAIEIQHHNPEAHYNLGYLMLERGDCYGAAKSLREAVAQDSRFADAHFNLAMALEQMGKRGVARNHWCLYLDLEPNGTWADIARRHVQ